MFTIHQKLIFAVRANNTMLVKERIRAGADMNYYDIRHGSALLTAIRSQNRELVDLLLSFGASVNVRDSFGDGPLEYALNLSNDDMIEAVYQAGAQLAPGSSAYLRALFTSYLKRR